MLDTNQGLPEVRSLFPFSSLSDLAEAKITRLTFFSSKQQYRFPSNNHCFRRLSKLCSLVSVQRILLHPSLPSKHFRKRKRRGRGKRSAVFFLRRRASLATCFDVECFSSAAKSALTCAVPTAALRSASVESASPPEKAPQLLSNLPSVSTTPPSALRSAGRRGGGVPSPCRRERWRSWGC
jgi:hypothetical protein